MISHIKSQGVARVAGGDKRHVGSDGGSRGCFVLLSFSSFSSNFCDFVDSASDAAHTSHARSGENTEMRGRSFLF